MNKRMKMLETLSQLIERDNTIKRHQDKLNKDIAAFIEQELGLQGPATLLDISKKILETSVDESLIITA
jgi:hypothetical protein